MRTFFRVASMLSLAFAVAHCGFLKKKTDEVADAEAEAAAPEAVADAAPVDAAPAPAAANENDVARFPDSVKLDNVPATIQRTAIVREIPQSGKAVQTLNKGQAVTQIESREKYFLVTFDKDPSTKLMGWVSADAFSALSLDAGLKAITCTAPEVPLYSDSAFCGRTCAKDADCAAGQACKGTAQTFTAGKIGASTSVCTVFKPADAGAPAIVNLLDAGHAAVASGDVVAPSAGNGCPVGFSFMNRDKQCHRLCLIGASCPTAKVCVPCEGKKVCSPNAAFCK